MEEKDEEKIMYEVRNNHWFNSVMEFDKQLLWLSAGAIAVLLNIGVKIDKDIKTFLFLLSLFSFSITIISILRVYKLNRKYLRNLIDKDEINEKISSDKTSFWDMFALISISIGVLSLIIYFILINISKGA